MRGKERSDYYWKLHTRLLDFVDLIKDQNDLRAKLKTKILDTAHEVQEELNENNVTCDNCVNCDCKK